MERLNWHLASELSRHLDIRVIGPRGAAQEAPTGVSVTEVALRPLTRFLVVASWVARREARLWKPDMILAGSGLTAPMAMLAARACGVPAAAYVHGLDLAVPHPVYRAMWHPALRRMDGLIANSRATASLATKLGVPAECIPIVPPGVAMPPQDPAARARFRDTYGIGDRKVLLSVGRLTARKGLREFVRDVLPGIVERTPDVLLVIVGNMPTNALYAKGQSPESIQATAEAAGIGPHLLFLGTRFGQELADAYAGADLHVFPVRHTPNDPEGFGMVSVEAAAHGLGTVAYASGGIMDAVSEGVSGTLVPPGDTEGFANAVLTLLDQPLSREALRDYAADFEWCRFGERILDALNTLSEQRTPP